MAETNKDQTIRDVPEEFALVAWSFSMSIIPQDLKFTLCTVLDLIMFQSVEIASVLYLWLVVW